MLAHEVVPALQKPRALGMGLLLPAFECLGRGVDRGPGLVAAHVGNGAENIQAGGIDDLDDGFRVRILPDTANQRLLAEQVRILQDANLRNRVHGLFLCPFSSMPQARLA